MNHDGISVYDQYNEPYYLMLPVSLVLGAVGYVHIIFNSTRVFLIISLWVAHAMGHLHDITLL